MDPMTMMAIASVGLSFIQGSQQAAEQRAAQRYADKMNAKRAKLAGVAMDTNLLRTRIDAGEQLRQVNTAENQAVANLRVQQAVGGASSDAAVSQTLHSFARQSGEATSDIYLSLGEVLAADKQQRIQLAHDITSSMSTSVNQGPGLADPAAKLASMYFMSKYGTGAGV